MADRQYVYKITEVVKVVDGDSFWLRCDVGFRQNILINVRLMGYDCPEAHKGSDYEKAQAWLAREYAAKFFESLAPIWVKTEKDPDNFGRWLGQFWYELEDGTPYDLGYNLQQQELATVWPTRWF